VAVDDQASTRDGGRFETRYSDEQLLGGVRLVLDRDLGLAPGSHLGQRPFDAADAAEDLSAFPSARQIATRLKRPWADVVQIAWQSDGTASIERAVMMARRAPASEDLEDRDNDLRPAGRRASADGPDHDAGRLRQRRRGAARREGTLAYWEELLPTAHQIARANAGWDVALAKAGLHPREGVTIGPRAKTRIDYTRKQLGLPTAEELAAEAAPKRKAAKKTAAKKMRKAPKKKAPAAPAEVEPDDQVIAPGRGGSKRKYRKSLTAVEAVALFTQLHEAWPTSRRVAR
jgi:hypothetical protein